MSLVHCSRNLTIGVPMFTEEYTKIRDRNVFTGLIGGIFDKLMASKNHR